LAADPDQAREIIRRRVAARVSRQEIIFELERMEISRADANVMIDEVEAELRAAVNAPATGGGVDPRAMLRDEHGHRPGTPFYKRPRTLISLSVTGLLIAFYAFRFFGGGTSDDDRIKALNAAAATNAPSDGKEGKVNILEIRAGDCLDGSFGQVDEQELEDVYRVKCGVNAQFKVLEQELMTEAKDAAYPSGSRFDLFAVEQCHEDTAFFLYPTSDSWKKGDRVMSCIGRY
jgi:hypothetical protein